jgi:hypothetical protein
MENNKGIILNGKNIKYISGPTSFYILTKEKKNIILFGDQHNNDNSLCDNCKIDNKCAIIWSDFLFLLNKESEKYKNNHNINFYCEFPIYDEKDNIDIELYKLEDKKSSTGNVNKNIVYCNNKKLYDEKCKYKNIIWYGCDIRQTNYNKFKCMVDLNSIYQIITFI